MSQESKRSDVAGSYTGRQQLFIRYFTAILIDLTVLNLFDEYWDNVVIESFTTCGITTASTVTNYT